MPLASLLFLPPLYRFPLAQRYDMNWGTRLHSYFGESVVVWVAAFSPNVRIPGVVWGTQCTPSQSTDTASRNTRCCTASFSSSVHRPKSLPRASSRLIYGSLNPALAASMPLHSIWGSPLFSMSVGGWLRTSWPRGRAKKAQPKMGMVFPDAKNPPTTRRAQHHRKKTKPTRTPTLPRTENNTGGKNTTSSLLGQVSTAESRKTIQYL